MPPLHQRYPIRSFLLLAYGLSWLCWLPIIDRISSNPFKSEPEVLVRLLLGGYGPSVAALILIAATGGRRAMRRLFERFRLRGSGRVGHAVALGWSPVLMSLSVFVFVARGGEVGYVHWPALAWVPVIFAAVSIFGPLGEELGWRGFLLPRLLERSGPIGASLSVGLVWTFWHAPLMMAAAGTSISGQALTVSNVLAYLVSVTASSVLFTWIHLRTRGNLFASILAHMSLNGTSVAVGFLLPHLEPAQTHALWLINVALLSVVALTLMLRWRITGETGAVGETGKQLGSGPGNVI